MIGPRDSVVRTMLGEDVPLDEWLRDLSDFVDSAHWHQRLQRGGNLIDLPPEFWIDRVRDAVGEDFADY